MQEHDLSYVRTEMVLAQAAPAGERRARRLGAQEPVRHAGRLVLTVIGLLIVACDPAAASRTGCSSTRSGPAPTARVCATVAQGGIQPDGWSGACWAFVNAKFEQFMFGRYPIDERWRPILTAVMFVALLVPLLMPTAPYKGLNAVAVLRRLPDRRLRPADRRLVRPAATSRPRSGAACW